MVDQLVAVACLVFMLVLVGLCVVLTRGAQGAWRVVLGLAAVGYVVQAVFDVFALVHQYGWWQVVSLSGSYGVIGLLGVWLIWRVMVRRAVNH
jgi:hypothetical protein